MQLTTQLIETIQACLLQPEAHSFSFRPIKDCFEISETVTAKYELANMFIQDECPNLPKLILYIVMDNIYGECCGKDKAGNLGYFLKFNPKKGKPG